MLHHAAEALTLEGTGLEISSMTACQSCRKARAGGMRVDAAAAAADTAEALQHENAVLRCAVQELSRFLPHELTAELPQVSIEFNLSCPKKHTFSASSVSSCWRQDCIS